MKLPISRARHDQLVAAKQSEIDGLKLSLEKEEGRANRIAGKLSIAEPLAAKAAHLEAENHRLTAELARLTTRGPGGRFVKVAKPNGTTEAAGLGAH